MNHIQGNNRNQIRMISLEKVDEPESMARFIDAFVKMINLQKFGFKYYDLNQERRPPIHPRTMMKLHLYYGYQNSVRSCRKLEHACRTNIEVMWLLSEQKPHYKTIANFRKDNAKAFKLVFRKFIDLDKEIENINTRIVALDSSITSSDIYFKNFKTADLKLIQLIDELCKVEYTFQYVYFNTNTIQTLESKGDIKLIPENIRNSLIELKRHQDRISLAAGSNYEIYLNAHEKALQLGFPRLRFQASKVNELELENKFADIILTSEGSLMLKNYTDKMVKKFLVDMLIEVNKIKEMITDELKDK